MTRASRNRNASLPVRRNIVTPTVNRDTHIPLTSPTVVESTGPGARKGKCPQKIGMWGTISTDYTTPGMTTHDARWSQTVQNRAV